MFETLKTHLRGLAKSGCAVGLQRSRLAAMVGASRRLNTLPLVVGYHRVVKDFQHTGRTSIAPMLVSTRTFEQQLDWIGERYRFVSLDELAHLFEEGITPRNPVAAVTFDDGYQDVYHNAFPILKRKGIPFAIFVVADLVNTSRMMGHDEVFQLLSRFFTQRKSTASRDLHAALGACELSPGQAQRLSSVLDKADPYLGTRAILAELSGAGLHKFILALSESVSETSSENVKQSTHSHGNIQSVNWQMLMEMTAGGGAVGSHSRSHALLPHESDQVIQQEVEGSRQILEQGLGMPVRHFAYPDGRFDSRTVEALVKAGYQTAYTVCRHQHPTFPQLTIPRTMLWENACKDSSGKFSPAILHCQVNGIFNPADKCREVH